MGSRETDEDVRGVVARGYDEVADEYGRLETEAEWPRMRWLGDLLRRLPKRSKVLDIGCGAGVPATREIAKRHHATGVDVSARQVALARRNVPNATFVHADVMDIDLEEESLDAIVSFYAFDHIPRSHHGELLRRTMTWLRPGGLLLLSIEDTDEPGTTGEWLGSPMFFSAFKADLTKNMVEEAGFVVLRVEVETQLEGSAEVPYTWILAQRPALTD